MKDRAPVPLTVALTWAVPLANRQVDLRHTYLYGSDDGVTAYWEYHDGEGNGREIINDPVANARFTIDVVKQIGVDQSNGDVDSKWKAYINVAAINPS